MGIIDWAAVNWTELLLLAGLVLFSSIAANLLNMAFGDNFVFGALLTALVFVACYLFWYHYPHGIDLTNVGNSIFQSTDSSLSDGATSSEPSSSDRGVVSTVE